jgi:hypothetical protein
MQATLTMHLAIYVHSATLTMHLAIYVHSATTEHGKEQRAKAREKNGNVSLMEVVNATATMPRAVTLLFKLFYFIIIH